MDEIHYWIPSGTGEVASKIMTPACNSSIRRHINRFGADAHRGGAPAPTTETRTCGSCWDYYVAVSGLGIGSVLTGYAMVGIPA